MCQVMTAIREVTEARARSGRMCITFSQWGRHDVGESAPTDMRDGTRKKQQVEVVENACNREDIEAQRVAKTRCR
jgi:hypothetical protein